MARRATSPCSCDGRCPGGGGPKVGGYTDMYSRRPSTVTTSSCSLQRIGSAVSAALHTGHGCHSKPEPGEARHTQQGLAQHSVCAEHKDVFGVSAWWCLLIAERVQEPHR